ncbi:MAG TPA: sialidase family protein [Candidatus Kapabacteria bacterium]|nr:sialidase family protein [Candidatus Kapabacteria bacterium]
MDRRDISAIYVLCVLFGLFTTGTANAQHLRIFACAIANDSADAFLGGSSNGSGLYQSDDTGKTWKHLGWDNIKCYSMDMVQSSNGRILYEATGLGVLRSADYGEHWKQLTDWRVSEAMDVAVNQKNPDEIYIATAHGAWKTKNRGKVWAEYDTLKLYFNRVLLDDSGHPEFYESDLHYVGGRPDQIDSADISYKVIISLDPPNSDPSFVLISTLGRGIYAGASVQYPLGEFAKSYYCDPCFNRLPLRQVWRLKSFLVTP